MKIYVKGMRNKAVVVSEGKKICEVLCKDLTDNECEWTAIAEAMKHVSGNFKYYEKVVICIDSKLVYKQLPETLRINPPEEKWRMGKLRTCAGHIDWNRLKNKMITTRGDDKFEISYQYVKSKENEARKYIDN